MNSFQFVHRKLCASPSESNIIGPCISCPKHFLVWQIQTKYKVHTNDNNLRMQIKVQNSAAKLKTRNRIVHPQSHTLAIRADRERKNIQKCYKNRKNPELAIKLNSKIVVWNMCFWVLALTAAVTLTTRSRITIRTAFQWEKYFPTCAAALCFRRWCNICHVSLPLNSYDGTFPMVLFLFYSGFVKSVDDVCVRVCAVCLLFGLTA